MEIEQLYLTINSGRNQANQKNETDWKTGFGVKKKHLTPWMFCYKITQVNKYE